MDQKELQRKKEMLISQIKKEKAKLNEYEKQLSLYEYKEVEIKKEEAKKAAAPAKKPAAKKPAAKKPAAKKVSPAKKPAAKKPVAAKPAAKPTPIGANKQNMRKHTIVPMSVYEKYEYEQRKKDWHKYSGMNEKQIVCDVCKDDDNFETVLLENGNHLCYYCWVKKPVALTPKQAVKTPAPVATKKVESKPVEVKKVESKPVEAKKESTPAKTEGNPKLFATISIILGILLVTLIVLLCIGIISSWSFKF